jgi:hypothetical protein
MNANPITHQYAYLKCEGLCYKTSLHTFQQPTTHTAKIGVLQSEKKSVSTKYFEPIILYIRKLILQKTMQSKLLITAKQIWNC